MQTPWGAAFWSRTSPSRRASRAWLAPSPPGPKEVGTDVPFQVAPTCGGGRRPARNLPGEVFLRTGDAVHLLSARARGLTEIYSNDRHLLRAAPHLGLAGRDLIEPFATTARFTRSRPTRGVRTTCTATSGNGSRTAGTENYARAPRDGSAWTPGGDCSRRVLRGGSWWSRRRELRSVNRMRREADDRTTPPSGFAWRGRFRLWILLRSCDLRRWRSL